MRQWTERSGEVASLLNPAFCCHILLEGLKEYKSASESVGLPYEQPFILLPLVLHSPTRNSLTKKRWPSFSSWVNDDKLDPIIISGYPQRAKGMVPIVREALLFGCQNALLEIKEDGLLYTSLGKINLHTMMTQDMKECINVAKIFGKWFAKYDDLEIVMMYLGVKP